MDDKMLHEYTAIDLINLSLARMAAKAGYRIKNWQLMRKTRIIERHANSIWPAEPWRRYFGE